jgi:hypothetical protein
MLEFATLGQMAAQVGRQVQSSDDAALVRYKESLNTHYGNVARGHRWPQLLRTSEERSSLTSGQKYLYLPKEVEQVYLIFPQNGAAPAMGGDLDTLIEQFSSIYAEAGVTVAFAEAGEVGYATDFYTTGETLTITHSGTGTVSGVVHGMTSGAEGETASVEEKETVSILQSTGAITTKTYKDLITVSVAELADNDIVTVVGTTSARTYAKIAAGERTARYKRIRLMQPSSTADPYTLIWKKRVARLIEDDDVVEIPVGGVLIDLVVSSALSSQREYSAATLHFQAAQAALESLKNATSIDTAIVHRAIPGMNLRRGYRYRGQQYP